MSYRGVHSARHINRDMDEVAGQVVTYRQYVSASAGVSMAGFAPSASYREFVLTAHLVAQFPYFVNMLNQRQTLAGNIVNGGFEMVIPFQPNPNDELVWRGEPYRIESEGMPANVDGKYIVILRRGQR